MPFGQVVIGPPGSGKTTYCRGMQQFLTGMQRNVAVINLDPANENLAYECAVDIAELITMEDVMSSLKLGPNGAMMYCIHYLETNFDWLRGKLEALGDRYVLFDLPGQVELHTHDGTVKRIVDRLQKLDYRLAAVHLVDAHYCTDPAKYISALMVSLKTMLMLELPHINVLSKIDLVESYGKLDFNLDYYTEVQDLDYLLQRLDDDSPRGRKYHGLNKALCELVEDFGLLGFYTLCIEDKMSVANVMQAIDKANGCVFGGLEMGNESIFSVAARADHGEQEVKRVQDRYIDHQEDDDVAVRIVASV
ncbi:GPN-loop GTPase [Thamnocephalis sphaerospora]|uniref:GPN-loop GTPase 2 n=1 Tax=Thamnocephalis sphaerospora TaxID=78915 RepID=A0A4P9XWQ8_9FUNG|nr:GPN-loop GTPase [Thamnocephalis sphaerospora]|eukprot:RKP10081.1 GPN-loop GTPase [Thamnocephalis sphaerospora]